MTTTDKPLDPLLALSEKATAGPWLAEGISVSAHHVADDPRLEYWLIERIGGNNRPGVANGRPSDNAAFIAALVNWFRANANNLADAAYWREMHRAANARGVGVWRDPTTDVPAIGQRVLAAYKAGRHIVVGAATYWDYKKGVHDCDSGPEWQIHEHDFLCSIVGWKEIPEYTPPTPGYEAKS